MKIDYKRMTELFDANMIEVLRDVESIMGGDAEIQGLHVPGAKGLRGTMPLRSVGIGCKNLNLGVEVRNAINGLWQYDCDRDTKLVCIFFEGEQRLHFQVHPNTIRRQ